MKLQQYLSSTGQYFDPTIVEIIDRTMKQMAIYHAKKNGADEKLLEDLNRLDSYEAFTLVEMMFGNVKEDEDGTN